MAQYRKRPVVIEASQCLAGQVIGEDAPEGVYSDVNSPTGFSIDTLEGKMQVTPGDWIITGVKGERYPCKPDVFEMTYEPVEGKA